MPLCIVHLPLKKADNTAMKMHPLLSCAAICCTAMTAFGAYPVLL